MFKLRCALAFGGSFRRSSVPVYSSQRLDCAFSAGSLKEERTETVNLKVSY
jgi:hypothetical protein